MLGWKDLPRLHHLTHDLGLERFAPSALIEISPWAETICPSCTICHTTLGWKDLTHLHWLRYSLGLKRFAPFALFEIRRWAGILPRLHILPPVSWNELPVLDCVLGMPWRTLVNVSCSLAFFRSDRSFIFRFCYCYFHAFNFLRFLSVRSFSFPFFSFLFASFLFFPPRSLSCLFFPFLFALCFFLFLFSSFFHSFFISFKGRGEVFTSPPPHHLWFHVCPPPTPPPYGFTSVPPYGFTPALSFGFTTVRKRGREGGREGEKTND